MTQETTPTRINFHFDPACPLAWRTALWIREVRKVRPIEVTWRLFSLETVNRKPDAEPDYVNNWGWTNLRSLALARRQAGNEGIERLYIALGNARHGRGENGTERQIAEAAVQEAGFSKDLVAQALADESTAQEVISDHEEAVKRYNAFGVPTIALEGSSVGIYGPIIHTVLKGDEAGEWWDHTAWVLQQPNLYEIKRERTGVEWGRVSAE